MDYTSLRLTGTEKVQIYKLSETLERGLPTGKLPDTGTRGAPNPLPPPPETSDTEASLKGVPSRNLSRRVSCHRSPPRGLSVSVSDTREARGRRHRLPLKGTPQNLSEAETGQQKWAYLSSASQFHTSGVPAALPLRCPPEWAGPWEGQFDCKDGPLPLGGRTCPGVPPPQRPAFKTTSGGAK